MLASVEMIVISTNVKMVESALIWSVITNVNVNLAGMEGFAKITSTNALNINVSTMEPASTWPMDTRANAKVDGMVGIANRISTNVSAINVRTEENV